MTSEDDKGSGSVLDLPFEVTYAPTSAPPSGAFAMSRNPDERRFWRWYWFVDPILGICKMGIHHVMRPLPVKAVSGMGAVLSKVSQRFYRDAPFARLIVDNMTATATDRSRADIVTAVDTWWENTGRVFAEFAIVGRLARLQSEKRAVRKALDRVVAAHENVLFVSVHIGNWEALLAFLDMCLSRPVIGPYQPEPSRFSNYIVQQSRRRRGQYMFPPGQKSAIYLTRYLRNQSAYGYFMIDEVHKGKSRFPLFGRSLEQTTNVTRAVKLAMRSNATIVPIIMPRQTDGQFKIVLLDTVDIQHAADPKATIRATVQCLNEVLEPVVRANLDQWFMLPQVPLGIMTRNSPKIDD